jgi:hypothetical protein
MSAPRRLVAALREKERAAQRALAGAAPFAANSEDAKTFVALFFRAILRIRGKMLRHW